MNQATLTAVIWQEGDVYVSNCPELGVASCGETPEKAILMLKEAVELYLKNAVQLGLWDDVKTAVEAPSRFTAPFEVTILSKRYKKI